MRTYAREYRYKRDYVDIDRYKICRYMFIHIDKSVPFQTPCALRLPMHKKTVRFY